MEKIMILDAEAFKKELAEEISKILPQKQNEKRWLRSSEVCEMMGISPSVLQQLRINGDIPSLKLSTGTWLYPYNGIVEALNARMTGYRRDRS